jgi:hypothetical protein
MGDGTLFIDMDYREIITIGEVKVQFHKKIGRKVRLKITADKTIPIKRDDTFVPKQHD